MLCDRFLDAEVASCRRKLSNDFQSIVFGYWGQCILIGACSLLYGYRVSLGEHLTAVIAATAQWGNVTIAGTGVLGI